MDGGGLTTHYTTVYHTARRVDSIRIGLNSFYNPVETTERYVCCSIDAQRTY